MGDVTIREYVYKKGHRVSYIIIAHIQLKYAKMHEIRLWRIRRVFGL